MAEDGRLARIRRIGAAVEEVHSAAQSVLAMAAGVGDLRHFGSEFSTALAVLEAASHIDELVDASRWIGRAYTYAPSDLASAEEREQVAALGSAVIALRGAVLMFDEASVSGET